MATYLYACNNCSAEFEVIQGINDLHVADCPNCHSITNKRIPCIFMVIDKTPHTLGSLAEQRRDGMGKYEYTETMQKMANDRRQMIEYKGFVPEGAKLVDPHSYKRPWWRPDRDTPDMKLSNLSESQAIEYTQNGKDLTNV